MKLKIFVLVDKTCSLPRRVLADVTAGKMLRDTINQDIGSNPGQIPFKDAAYYEVGSLDYETLRLEALDSPKEIDVLHEYQFQVETPVKHEETSESSLDDSVTKGKE